MKSKLILLLSTWFYSGKIKYAPGTMGTLAAIPLYILIKDLSSVWYLLVSLMLFCLGVWTADHTERIIDQKDPGLVVIDEVVGFLITMMGAGFTYLNLILGFILFRIFDIIKPWPISYIDKKFTGGFGIMFDDIVAGLFACLALNYLTKYISF